MTDAAAGEGVVPRGEGARPATASAVIEERQLLKTLKWWDGFVIGLCNPGFLISFLGFSIGALGAWGAMALWAICAAVGLLQAWIYSEPAAMFPEKPGGIALYAHEGWRRYFTLVGPVATFGYWIGWSVVLSIFGKTIGDLITSEWWPTQVTGAAHAWTGHFPGSVTITTSDLIAIGCIVAVWLFNIIGLRPSVNISYVIGGGLLVVLAVLILGPYISGTWHSSNLQWSIPSGFTGAKLALVWLFLMGWSVYGVEICATFAPEFHDTRRDTALALRTTAAFSLLVALFLPMGVGGVNGVSAMLTNPATAASAEGQFYTSVFNTIVGSGPAKVLTVLLIGSLFLSMLSSTGDGARALYGIARDDMTVKQLHHLNRHHVPGRAMTVDLVVNCALVLFISSNLAILYMSNIGYITAHVFALSGVLLLRKDRPRWPRPIKLKSFWLLVAAVLAVYNAVLVAFGIANPTLTGYGTKRDLYIGLSVLAISIILFVFRRLVQDRKPVNLREQTPTMPEEIVGSTPVAP